MIEVTRALLRANPLPKPGEGDKDARGRVLVVGGHVQVPGAVLLAGEAALRAGAGRLRLATCRSIAPALALAVPEARVMGLPETPKGDIAPEAAPAILGAAKHVDAVLVGPGMLEMSDQLGEAASRLEVPVVLDAGALGCLDGHGEPPAPRIITPHAGEMAKLLGRKRDEIETDPAAAGLEAAHRFGCTVVIKGAQTHIIEPAGQTYLFTGGTVGLATSGSGDALAGIIVGLLARGAAPVWAAIWGVFLHGEAGTRLFRHHGGIGFLAREIAGEVPRIMSELGSAADA